MTKKNASSQHESIADGAEHWSDLLPSLSALDPVEVPLFEHQNKFLIFE